MSKLFQAMPPGLPKPDAVFHVECGLRMIFGSVGHQLHKCGCYGGDEDDPEGMTRREAAAAAVRLYYKVHFPTTTTEFSISV